MPASLCAAEVSACAPMSVMAAGSRSLAAGSRTVRSSPGRPPTAAIHPTSGGGADDVHHGEGVLVGDADARARAISEVTATVSARGTALAGPKTIHTDLVVQGGKRGGAEVGAVDVDVGRLPGGGPGARGRARQAGIVCPYVIDQRPSLVFGQRGREARHHELAVRSLDALRSPDGSRSGCVLRWRGGLADGRRHG